MASTTFAYTQPYLVNASASVYRPGAVTTQAVSTAKFLGYPGAGMMGSDALESLYSTLPAHQWYWHVFCEGATTNTTTQRVLVTIDYDMLWFDKVDGGNDYYERLKIFKEMKRVVPLKSDKFDNRHPAPSGTLLAGDENTDALEHDGDQKRIDADFVILSGARGFKEPTPRYDEQSGSSYEKRQPVKKEDRAEAAPIAYGPIARPRSVVKLAEKQ
jgi:hypothetical protein